MKKIFSLLVILSLLISVNIKANPITVPPVTSELYFENNNWKLELVFDFNYCYSFGIYYSDSLFLITRTDTVNFKPGWDLLTIGLIVVTKDSLVTPIQIDINGDYVCIAYKQYGYYHNLDDASGSGDFIFGNYPNSTVTAPLPGQTIKRTAEYCGYSLVKDNNPTIGFDPFNASTTSSINGYVYDSNHNPFPGIHLYGFNCFPWPITDSNGYFENNDVYACFQHIYPYSQFCISPDTSLFFEPDSSYFLEFTFDSCFVGINDVSRANNYSLTVFPNPGSENFTFLITAPNIRNENCLIKIYNITGELVNIIPVKNIQNSSAVVTWNGNGEYSSLPSGLYTCSLVINGNTITSKNLIIGK